MKIGKLPGILVSFVLVASLFTSLLVACAPAAPEEAAEEVAELEGEIDDLEADLATSEKKVKNLEGEVGDLEEEIAALKKPFEVQAWEPATWAGAGIVWDQLVYISDYITNMSDGRIVVTPSLPGAVCPVEEQLEAVATGATEAMAWADDYYPGKIPVCIGTLTAFGGPKTTAELHYIFEELEGGKITQLMRDTFAEYGDVYFVKYFVMLCNDPVISAVPINGIADIKGMPFRTSDIVGEVLAYLGAGTVWCPGDEIYTMLATGLVDAITYSSPNTDVAMSFHEVTKYWIKKPRSYGPGGTAFGVNATVWKALPDDLKAIVVGAIDGSHVVGVLKAEVEEAQIWKFLEDYGIEFIEWSDEDVVAWGAAFVAVYREYIKGDPVSAEFVSIIEPWLIEMGYWEEGYWEE